MDTSTPAAFTDAKRESTSFLMAVEKRCLIWMARRLPSWVHSDHLTLLALVAMATAGLSYWASRYQRFWLLGVVVSLAVNWFGDSLDGTLARVRGHQRPRYGFYVDHVVDCFGVLFLLGGLAVSGFMHPLIALGLLSAYFMLSIEIYLATYSLTVFRLSFAGMGPTELRLLLAAGTLALLRDPHVELFGGRYALFDFGGAIAIAAIFVVLLFSVFRNARALYLAEPLPAGPAHAEGGPRSTAVRWAMFNAVGGAGIAVQLGVLWALTDIAGVGHLLAIAIAVEAAILHNFLWHRVWTWSDRPAPAGVAVRRLARFNLTTGLISIAGNIAVTAALMRLGGVHYLAANAIAIAACSLVNFLVSHRLVFVPALGLSVVMVLAPAPARAAELSPAAAEAFERDARAIEKRLDAEREGRSPFLWIDRLPSGQRADVNARLAAGRTVVHRIRTSDMPGAMAHHWMATTVLPGVALARVVSLMQGYERYQDVYRPAVRGSRVIRRDGDRFIVSLQLFMKKIVSVVLNTEQVVTYAPIDRTRMQVRSRSTRVAEVENPGTSEEKEAPPGQDSGYLWRFNNYCSLDERQEGTYVQCESLSLSRDTPFGLGWLIGPFVTSIPRESLEFTMSAIRASLQKGA